MVALADNPAVTDPRRALTATQRDALLTVGHYKDQIPRGKIWFVGRKRFSSQTINSLVKAGLLAGNGKGVWPTIAGKMAIDKLKGAGR